MNNQNTQKGGMIVALKIDVLKISREKLFTGKNGAKYLDCVVFIDNEKGQYGDNGMIVEDVSKEDKANGVKGVILGNCRIIRGEVAGQSHGAGIANQMRPPMQQATPVNRGATNNYDQDDSGIPF
jgi:hypothetical protein